MRWWLVGVVAAGLLAALAPGTLAHNPASTVYEPTAFHGDLLVLGEEGTAARVTTDGTTVWQATLDGQILQPAVHQDGVAATVLRTVPDARPVVQAFDAEGPSWTAPLTDAREVGFAVPAPDGFLALASDGTMLRLGPDGTQQTATNLSLAARTAPVPAPGGGWVVAGEEGRISIVDETGAERVQTRLGGPPTDLARHGDLVLAAVRRADVSSVKALDAELTTQWIVDRNALRVGGELAVDADAIYLGTFRPAGAHAVALSPNGSTLWERAFENETAAAATVADGVYVTVNSGVHALDDAGEIRWSAELEPRVVGPAVVDDLVLPSGAENRLVALHASNGTVAWTWTDGVDTVPWTDEQLASGDADGGASGQEQEASESPVWLPAVLVSLALACVLWRPNRR